MPSERCPQCHNTLPHHRFDCSEGRSHVTVPVKVSEPGRWVTVHILFNGRALCLRPHLDPLPGLWPDSEKWVHVQDAEKATCLDCLLRLPVDE